MTDKHTENHHLHSDHHDHHHTHGHAHSHAHAHATTENIAVAFFLNLAFAIIEFVGGMFTNSIAIVSDAVHDLGDALVIGTSFFLERKSGKEADAAHSYGYKRYSVLGAVITTCVLIVGAVLIVVNAIPRLIIPEPANYDGMLVLAIFGVAVNGFAAWRTSGGHSLNQRAVSLHMLEDVLGWIAVLIGAAVMKFIGWAIIDPILSIAIACFIGYNAIQNMRGVLPIFLEKTPHHLDTEEIQNALVKNIEGLGDVHHVHIWSLDENITMATLHAVAKDGYETSRIKCLVKEQLAEYGIIHSTVEMEAAEEKCPDDCATCPISKSDEND